jgi:hypothetical protein
MRIQYREQGTHFIYLSAFSIASRILCGYNTLPLYVIVSHVSPLTLGNKTHYFHSFY